MKKLWVENKDLIPLVLFAAFLVVYTASAFSGERCAVCGNSNGITDCSMCESRVCVECLQEEEDYYLYAYEDGRLDAFLSDYVEDVFYGIREDGGYVFVDKSELEQFFAEAFNHGYSLGKDGIANEEVEAWSKYGSDGGYYYENYY